MANLLDSLSANKNTPTVTNTSTEVKGEKTQLSLFDSLLKNSIASTENTNEEENKNITLKANVETKVTSVSNTSTEDTEVLSDKNTVKTEKQVITEDKSIKVNENTQEKTSQTNNTNSNNSSSLLDRLVVEAKNTIKTENKVNEKINTIASKNDTLKPVDTLTSATTIIPKTSEDNSSETVTKIVIKDPIKTEKQVVLEDKNVKVNENNQEKTSQTNNTNSNNTSSLLDRLVVEAKNTIKIENKVNEKTNTDTSNTVKTENKVNTLNSSTTLIPEVSEVKSSETVTKEPVKTENKVNEKINTVVSKNNTLKPVDTLISPTTVIPEISEDDSSEIVIKEPIKTEKQGIPEDKNIKVNENNQEKTLQTNNPNNTSSLLDRLVVEAKNTIKTENKVNEKINTVTSKNNTLNSVDTLTSPTTVIPEISEDDSSKIVIKEPIKTVKQVISEDKNIKIQKENLQTIVNPNELQTDTSININSSNLELEVKNENLANQLASIPKSNDQITKVEKKSLMDQLIDKLENHEEKKESREIKSIKTLNEFENRVIKKGADSKEFITNIYLSSQKNSINNQALLNKNEAINLAKDGKSISDIQTSAKMLDLGLEDLDVDTEVSIEKKIDLSQLDRKNLLDKLAFDKNIKHDDIKNLITKSVEASKALIEDTITKVDDISLTVNSPISQNLQTRIIGAKQQMSNMMSDIAKQMYENYKPPVTVFRINLNPLHLGSIAIMMKSDKDNGISISMNISNNSTLDAMVDNQNNLRTSLNKSFDENTKFNLDFSSSQENSKQSSNQNQSGNRNFEENITTQSILESREENIEVEDRNIDYM